MYTYIMIMCMYMAVYTHTEGNFIKCVLMRIYVYCNSICKSYRVKFVNCHLSAEGRQPSHGGTPTAGLSGKIPIENG